MSPGPFFLHSIHSLCLRPPLSFFLFFFSCPLSFCLSVLSHYHAVFLSFPLLVFPLCTPSTLYSLAPCQSEVFPSYLFLSPLSIFLPFLPFPIPSQPLSFFPSSCTPSTLSVSVPPAVQGSVGVSRGQDRYDSAGGDVRRRMNAIQRELFIFLALRCSSRYSVPGFPLSEGSGTMGTVRVQTCSAARCQILSFLEKCLTLCVYLLSDLEIQPPFFFLF